MTEKVRSTIKEYGMLKKGSTVIVGLSGGADSITLAHILLGLKDEYSLNLIAAHVNHGIRGEEADRDENFVKNFCRENNLCLEVLKANIPDECKKTGESEEECGRRIRYDFFNKIDGNALIATAHNLNDSIETFFINLSRGTGAKGLAGIPPKRGNIIRPLIFCSRDEIEKYCKENSLEFVTDSTNLSNEYTRNKIRNIVLPVFDDINPSFSAAMARLFENLDEDNRALSRLTAELIEKADVGGKYNANVLDGSLSALKKRAISYLCFAYTGKIPEKKHIDLISSLLLKSGAVEISNNAFAFIKDGFLYFGNNIKHSEKWSVKISDFGKSAVSPYKRYHFKQIAIKDLQNVQKGLLENSIDCDKIIGTVELRSRNDGDLFKQNGRGVTKTLKKLFNENKIPLENRNKIAVLSDENGVLWVEGFGAAEKAAVTDKTKNIFFISEEERNDEG